MIESRRLEDAFSEQCVPRAPCDQLCGVTRNGRSGIRVSESLSRSKSLRNVAQRAYMALQRVSTAVGLRVRAVVQA